MADDAPQMPPAGSNGFAARLAALAAEHAAVASEPRTLGLPLTWLSGRQATWGRQRFLGAVSYGLAFVILADDLEAYGLPGGRAAVLNGDFLTGLFVAACTAAAELLHRLDLAGARHQYELSVSLIWGGFALFAATLVRLFAYDLSALTTIAKTVVLAVLGMLLLVTSFVYTEYQSRVGAGDEE